ncbi:MULTISPECIES: ThuA domain-containing protein [unclassified Salinibacterium]|uniref:ThuA domain-containing protein n=1 Tax=unclassified Salinibacterium TaxID=2632331 RepID=UPI001421B8CE|nr:MULTISPECIES: ThuA domain-containing protein [unclassified Salinibacterium]
MTEGQRQRIAVVCGTGAHTDSWHDLPATSRSLADAIAVATRATTAVHGLDELAALDRPDALVVNASGDMDAPLIDSRPVVDEILALHAAGVRLLAVHSAAYAFRDDPRWASLLGGRWVPGVSGHPPLGAATIDVAGADAAAPASFTVIDERYTGLEVAADVTVVASHRFEGRTHPLAWTRDGGLVAYSALGHDPRSHTSAGHRALLARLLSAPSA